jgi:hypothetical protein
MRVLLAGPDFEENLSIRYLASSLQAKRHETVIGSVQFGANRKSAGTLSHFPDGRRSAS